ncbi:hypothetical protein D5018_17405 [Parashewanella curva]|uniref:Uncharacterized protein n=2 Tax=Parashewanella curva TaxID=2338552 RepID=A0A3L8PWJ1_9GAMM|nr:hypothetical protein D5018_17405 [Parashewanella curva]
MTVFDYLFVAKTQPALTQTQINNFPIGFEVEISIIRDLCSDDGTRFDTIDNDSLRNMSLGLRFAGISTHSEARELDIQIIPPAPIFHIWVSLRGASFFDGYNNPRCLDYVSRITKQADFLLQHDIPLFIVYTEKNMSDVQKQEMASLFTEHPNIMVLSVEKHLSHLPMAFSYSEECRPKDDYGETFDIDGLRLSVLMDYPEVFDVLEKEAIKQEKLDFVSRLKALGKQSLIYHDIDDQFLQRPPFFLARKGVMGATLLSREAFVEFQQQIKELRDYNVPSFTYTRPSVEASVLTADEIVIFQKQRAQLILDMFNSHFDVELFSLVPTRNLYAINHPAVMKMRTKLTDTQYQRLRSSQHDYRTFEQLAFQPYPANELQIKARKLDFMQQLNYTFFGRDNSWK